MKTISTMAIAILFSATSAFASPTHSNPSTDSSKSKKVKPVKTQYTCTMHPEFVSNKPGKCPKCGMTLVKKESTVKKKANGKKAEKMSM